uniref:Mediator of RNA polymerase II transcription subunit 22 n=1 Tax=Caenorhabditis tropicalis TaxID=1561998 RepID=A0A1I7TZY6_9PELO
MYEPIRQVLDFRHIEQINKMTFHFRKLSRQVTSHIGMVPNAIVGQLRGLTDRIANNIEYLEEDMARNERAPFEAKLDYYRQEYQEMTVYFNELVNNLHITPSQQ